MDRVTEVELVLEALLNKGRLMFRLSICEVLERKGMGGRTSLRDLYSIRNY